MVAFAKLDTGNSGEQMVNPEMVVRIVPASKEGWSWIYFAVRGESGVHRLQVRGSISDVADRLRAAS